MILFLSGLSAPEEQGDDPANFRYDNGFDVGYSNFYPDMWTWTFLGVPAPSRTVSYFLSLICRNIDWIQVIKNHFLDLLLVETC